MKGEKVSLLLIFLENNEKEFNKTVIFWHVDNSENK